MRKTDPKDPGDSLCTSDNKKKGESKLVSILTSCLVLKRLTRSSLMPRPNLILKPVLAYRI